MLRTAHEISPELMGLPDARMAVDCAQAILRRTGRPPSSSAAVIQEAAARREDGKATHEEVRAVAGIFDLFDARRPQLDDVEPPTVATLRQRLRFAVAQAAIDEHNEDEWRNLHKLVTREQRLGVAEEGTGVMMTNAGIRGALSELRGLKRVALGIDALDEGLLGGVPNGTLTCFMAGPGGGKSMAMSHCAATQSMGGRFVAYATLEVPTPYVIARILACQSGVAINDILAAEAAEVDALKAITHSLYRAPAVRDFAPHVTTVESLQEWVKEIEDKEGRKLDSLVVDYADKLTASGKVDEKGMYQEMRVVYEKLRVWMDSEKILGLTASQSKARDEKGKNKGKSIDMEHVADSMHKARIVDQFITLNFDDDTQEMTFFIAKSRYSEGRKSIGPLPTNYSVGQVAPIARIPRVALPVQEASMGAFNAAHALGASVTDAIRAAQDAGDRKLEEIKREPGDDGDPVDTWNKITEEIGRSRRLDEDNAPPEDAPF